MNIELAIQDFRYFLKETWSHLRLPPPTRMQLYIADYLQEGHKRSQLEALRGIGKTWITGAYVCWRLLRNPNEKVLIVSQSGAHSDNIAIFIRKLIDTMPILQHLQPRSDQRSSVIAFDVDGCDVAVQPSVKSLGITSQLQGNRASLLISDDVEGQQNSATELRRQQLLSQVAEYEAILQTDNKSQILVLGTPQSSESIYNRLRDKGYVTKIFPARYPDKLDNYQGCLADYLVQDMYDNPSLINKPTDVRFTEEDLYHREMSYGLSGFKLQFMLDTTLSDSERYPLKASDLIVTDLDYTTAPIDVRWTSEKTSVINEIPNVGFTGDSLHRGIVGSETSSYEGSILAIDPSGRGADKTGIAVVNHLNGKIYVPYIGNLPGGYEETLVAIAELANRYKVNKVLVESNFGDGMYCNLLKPVMNAIYPCTIEEVRVNTQKERRIIDTLEPLLNQHRLVMDYSNLLQDTNTALSESNSKGLPHSFIFQLTHITKDRGSLQHDDVIDVLALGCSYWNEYGILKQNTDEALATYKKKQIQQEINRRRDIFNRQNNVKKTSSAVAHLKAFR